MSAEAQLLLNALQLTNALLGAARELRVSYDELAQVMARADEEGREVTVADLEELRSGSEAARDSLRDAIARARTEGKV